MTTRNRVFIAKLVLIAIAFLAVVISDGLVARGAAVGSAIAVFLLFFILMSNVARRFFMSKVGYWFAFGLVTLMAGTIGGDTVTGFIAIAYANICKVALLDMGMWWFKDDVMTWQSVKDYWSPKVKKFNPKIWRH